MALDEDELARVLEACDMGVTLNDAKNTIFMYVESRMLLFAPNLSHICGPSTAAKLMGACDDAFHMKVLSSPQARRAD